MAFEANTNLCFLFVDSHFTQISIDLHFIVEIGEMWKKEVKMQSRYEQVKKTKI